MAVEGIVSTVTRTHRTIGLYPSMLFEDGVYTKEKFDMIFDKNTSAQMFMPGYKVYCSLPDDFDLTKDVQTEDAMDACDDATRQIITGYSYELSGQPTRDADVDNYSASNLMRLVLMAPDRQWTVVDFFGSEIDAREITPEGGIPVGARFEAYEFDTDVFRDVIASNSNAAFQMALIPKGKLVKGRVKIGDNSATAPVVTYAAKTPFRSNENLDLLIGLSSSLSNFKAPDINELNDTNLFRNIVGVVPFSDITFPKATASESDSDPMINQNAQAQTRGNANYEGTDIGTLLVRSLSDVVTTQGWLTNLIDVDYDGRGVDIVAVVRIAQDVSVQRGPIKAGDFVSVYGFKIVATHNDSTGNRPYRITSQWITRGQMVVNTFAIDGAAPTETIVITTATGSKNVGKFDQYRATAYGHDVTTLVDWMTDNPKALKVANTGTSKYLAAGTANVRASHDALKDGTLALTVVAAPTVTVSSSIPSLPVAGGLVSVTGTNLEYITGVTIDGTKIYDYGRGVTAGAYDSTKGQWYVPPHAAGSVSIVVDQANGAPITLTATYA